MTLGKIATDNVVKHIAQSEQTRDRDSKPNTIKNNSLPKNQKKNFSQNIKKFIKDYVTRERFGRFKGKMNCYFQLKTY